MITMMTWGGLSLSLLLHNNWIYSKTILATYNWCGPATTITVFHWILSQSDYTLKRWQHWFIILKNLSKHCFCHFDGLNFIPSIQTWNWEPITCDKQLLLSLLKKSQVLRARNFLGRFGWRLKISSTFHGCFTPDSTLKKRRDVNFVFCMKVCHVKVRQWHKKVGIT